MCIRDRRRIEAETLRHFNFAALRSGQLETLAAVLRGESVLSLIHISEPTRPY